MINTKITGSSENVQIAQAVAREYGIKPSIVKKVMEEAITAASQKKYGSKYKVRARMDMNNGQVTLERILTVVDEVEDADTEISLQAAKRQNPEVELGGEICSKLPAIDVERGAANIAKQIIQKGIKEALNEKVFHDFKDRIGDVLLTVVDSFERGNVIVDLGNKVKAIIPKSETIISEKLKKGDRVLTYISDVSLDNPNYIIALSRSHNHLVGELLKQEVPEIEENIIEIKSIAREPGSLAKVAVYTSETGLDPVGSCVGIRGSLVQAVTNEIAGEKIHIINWSADPATFVINALNPAEISKVVMDEEHDRIEVIVAEDQLSRAIGRRGQNVRLASQLTGWKIDVMTEEEEAVKRQEEFTTVTALFIESLNVDETLAQLLAAEGFGSVDDILSVSIEDIASIEGLDEDIAAALHERASEYMAEIEVDNTASDDLSEASSEYSDNNEADEIEVVKTDNAESNTEDAIGTGDNRQERKNAAG